jgi:uncharacterized protein (DUF2461 family)
VSDQDVILDAIEDAQRILAEHIEPTSRRTPEATIEADGTSASHPFADWQCDVESILD